MKRILLAALLLAKLPKVPIALAVGMAAQAPGLAWAQPIPAPVRVGTTAGTFAAGNDPRIATAMLKTNNLSDLSSVATARTNLGLTAPATAPFGTTTGAVADGGVLATVQTTANAAVTPAQLATPAITGGSINGTTPITTSGNVTITGVTTIGGASAIGGVTGITTGGVVNFQGITTFSENMGGFGVGGTFPATGMTVGWNLNGGSGDVDMLLGPGGGNGGLNVYALNGSTGKVLSTTPVLAVSNGGALAASGSVRGPYLQVGASTGPTIANGLLAPLTTTVSGVTGGTSGTPAAGSEYVNTAGAAGARVYWYFGSAWIAQAAP